MQSLNTRPTNIRDRQYRDCAAWLPFKHVQTPRIATSSMKRAAWASSSPVKRTTDVVPSPFKFGPWHAYDRCRRMSCCQSISKYSQHKTTAILTHASVVLGCCGTSNHACSWVLDLHLAQQCAAIFGDLDLTSTTNKHLQSSSRTCLKWDVWSSGDVQTKYTKNSNASRMSSRFLTMFSKETKSIATNYDTEIGLENFLETTRSIYVDLKRLFSPHEHSSRVEHLDGRHDGVAGFCTT